MSGMGCVLNGMPYYEKDVAMKISTFVFPGDLLHGLCSKWNDFLLPLIQGKQICPHGRKNSLASSPAVNLMGAMK